MAENPNRYVGSLVLTAFGGFWLVSSFVAAGGDSLVWLVTIAAGAGILGVASVVRFSQARRRAAGRGEKPARGWVRLWFSVVVAAEAVAIYSVVQVLVAMGLTDWIGAGLILIVGLHFFPLARIFRYRAYAGTGLALVLIAVVFPWLLANGPNSPLLSLAAGVVLWSTAGHIVSRSRSRATA